MVDFIHNNVTEEGLDEFFRDACTKCRDLANILKTYGPTWTDAVLWPLAEYETMFTEQPRLLENALTDLLLAVLYFPYTTWDQKQGPLAMLAYLMFQARDFALYLENPHKWRAVRVEASKLQKVDDEFREKEDLGYD